MNEPKRISRFESRYHKVRAIEKDIYYYCCPKDCQMCLEWSKPGQAWKSITFFPYHCHLCSDAGWPDDFYFLSRFLVCQKCYLVYLKRLDHILRRQRSEADYKYLLERKENI